MPLHDWTRVPAGLYHDFHQTWAVALKRALNAGRLPAGYDALVEQRSFPRESDVLAIETRRGRKGSNGNGSHHGGPGFASGGGTAVLAPPRTRFAFRSDAAAYSGKANRVAIKHHLGRTVAIIELVSPGNKDRRSSLRDFVEKTASFAQAGVHVLLVDPFPPTPRDPDGLHKAVWDEIGRDEPFAFPAGHDRLAASYDCGAERAAYVETFAVGEPLPTMPLFLAPGEHVPTPLEDAYQSAWAGCPASLQHAVETGELPSDDDEE